MKSLLLAICLFAAASNVTADTNTVADNPSLSKAVEENLSPKLAGLILNTPYDGFYKINGKMKRRGDYKFNKVKDKNSFPDDRWENVALNVTDRVNFSGDANMVGSRTKPSATAYVVMFKDGIDGVKHTGDGESLALVMIDQQNALNRDLPTVKESGTALYLMDVSMTE